MVALTSYTWKPIEDLPGDLTGLVQSELRSLSQIWMDQKAALEDVEGLRAFNERLKRESAIETGVLERLYTLDRGITQLLIERGIDAAFIPRDSTNRNPELVAAMIRDHESAVDFLFDFVKQQRSLSTSYIKELHALLTRHQASTEAIDTLGRRTEVPILKGTYKTLPNNPSRANGSVHEYCPPEHVASEMDRLLQLHEEHERRDVPPEVEAAWLHHRFTQIHPFQDGNGRVARCLATLVFVKAQWFPLVVTRDERERYILALEAADRGNLTDLVRLFSALQKQAFVRALGISARVLSRNKPEQVIGAAKDLLAERDRAIRVEWERAKQTAARLQQIAEERFRQIAVRLDAEVGQFFPQRRFSVDSEPPGGERGHYFRWQIRETARRLRYHANLAEYRAWTRLLLREHSQSEILLSFHAAGQQFRGIVAVSPCFFRREETEDREREVVDLTPLADEIFQVNYREPLAEAEQRFRPWLEEVLTRGLEAWRLGL